ncbi:calcium/proton exchanger, partial [Tanacetum coccineum]
MYKVIPHPPTSYYSNYAYGFGYGSTPDDLKIVRIEVNIRSREYPPPDPDICDDLIFSEIHLSYQCDNPMAPLGTLEGYLCVIHASNHTRVEVWVMKEYGIVDSWSRICSITFSVEPNCTDTLYPMCILKNKKILMVNDLKQLFIYDIRKGSYKKLHSMPFLDTITRLKVFFTSMTRFMTTLHHNGVFIQNPLKPKTIIMQKPGTTLVRGITEIKSASDIEDFMTLGYQNGFKIDLYAEHHGYDVMEMVRDDNFPMPNEHLVEDDPDENECVTIPDFVDVQVESDDNVVINSVSTNDPFLNKLVGNGNFIGTLDEQDPPLEGTYAEESDPEEDILDMKYKVNPGISYPTFNPATPWNEQKPILGMKYETPLQLKQSLANYGVANGFQMWYMRNDFRCLLVYCGRDIAIGRCASKRKLKGVNLTSTGQNEKTPTKGKGKGKGIADNEKTPTKGKGKGKGIADNEKTPTKGKGKGIADESQPESANTPTKWTKERIKRVKDTPSSHYCTFRLWASWMSSEKSFQIKSLYPDHKCVRNYNMGSLVTYKWIASHYAKEIINNPFITVRYMQNDIREKFMVDVSLGQCKRAKQCAMYDHEGGLVEHYNRLWEYRQAVLESNPGSTCHLDVEDDEGIAYFKSDDLELDDGDGATIISDGHKGLLEAVRVWLPRAQHRQCTRHIYANFKRKWTGTHYRRLFWAAAATTIRMVYQQNMEEIRQLDQEAYNYLIGRDPSTWSRAFFGTNNCSASFENGISESFNSRILVARGKPIITMLEDIRL